MNIVQRRYRQAPIGCNVGPNKVERRGRTRRGDRRSADCWSASSRRWPTYLVVNISSPNTASLRELQGKEALPTLLTEVGAANPADYASNRFS